MCTVRTQMKFAKICVAVAAIIAPFNFSGQATPQPKQSEIDSADRLFQAGKFAEAGKIYSQIVAQNPKDYSATLHLGRISLLSNRLDDAQKWLEKAIALKPGDADPKVMLAETFYRRDDFQKAVAALKGVDVSSNKLITEQYPCLSVAKLKSFKGQTPYELHGNGTSTRLKFVRTDPLPVVNVRVNGGDEVTFFIDTGGSEVSLDTEFAKELGVPNSVRYKALFPAGNTLTSSLGGLNHSPSAIGPSKICPRQCFLCANFQKAWA
jgi:tetratricopeptide (TPR) repeat protein